MQKTPTERFTACSAIIVQSKSGSEWHIVYYCLSNTRRCYFHEFKAGHHPQVCKHHVLNDIMPEEQCASPQAQHATLISAHDRIARELDGRRHEEVPW